MDSTAPTDLALLDAWAAGDANAGNQFVERHFGLVYRFFANKVGSADVEDLVQQTLLACLESRLRYESRAKFATFLLGIARNHLFMHYRMRRREPAERVATSVHDHRTSPTGALAKLEDTRLLQEALRHIPLDAQVLLELAYCEGMPGGEMADVLGIAANALHVRLHRARESLRDVLRELAPDRLALAERAGQLLARDA